jgi:hypothetical protein
VRGLGKNIFASCDYRTGQFLLVGLSLLVLFWGSLAGDLLAHGVAQGLFDAAEAICLLRGAFW